MANNNKALDESVRNIFSLPQVVDIERQILDLYRNMTHSRGDHCPDKEHIKQLLLDRKEMLDQEFVMGVGYKQLLLEFNDALRQQLIKLHKNILKTGQVKKSVDDLEENRQR